MSEFFGDDQHALQERFETRAMADRIAALTVHAEVQEQDKLFIESRDMFFLASVDERGQPTCSYKGGESGFVRVLDAKTIAFPSYDGNGMFISLGNIRPRRHAKLRSHSGSVSTSCRMCCRLVIKAKPKRRVAPSVSKTTRPR